MMHFIFSYRPYKYRLLGIGLCTCCDGDCKSSLNQIIFWMYKLLPSALISSEQGKIHQAFKAQQV